MMSCEITNICTMQSSTITCRMPLPWLANLYHLATCQYGNLTALEENRGELHQPCTI